MLPHHITPSAGKADGPTWALRTSKWATQASCSNDRSAMPLLYVNRSMDTAGSHSDYYFKCIHHPLHLQAAKKGCSVREHDTMSFARTSAGCQDEAFKINPCRHVLLPLCLLAATKCRSNLQSAAFPNPLQAAEKGYLGGSALDNQKLDTLADAYKELRAAKREAAKAAKAAEKAEKAAQVSRVGTGAALLTCACWWVSAKATCEARSTRSLGYTLPQ